jgi:glutamine amidotransferase
MNVVILDTGCANLNSVKSAISRHGYEPVVSRDPDVVLRADKLFYPAWARRRQPWIRSTSVSWLT